MRRLDLTEPQEAVRQGMVVPFPPGGVVDRMVSTAMLRPYASQVLVGGIGAGKTTQVLVACDRVKKECADTWPVYVDVSEHHTLKDLSAGVLVAIAGLRLAGFFKPEGRIASAAVRAARDRVWGWARGAWVEADPFDDDEAQDPGFWRPGILREKRFDDAFAHYLPDLKVLCEALPEAGRHVVMFFDSLDRLESVEAFVTAVEQDVRALRQLGIGVVMTAPLTSMFGSHRADLDRFDEVLHLPAVDVSAGATGKDFLVEVLARRAPEGLLGQAAAERLADVSGGVMRDLIALARSAAEEAYMSGADELLAVHVERASDRFGRKRLQGLRSNELERLQEVMRTGEFVSLTDDDLALLVTRRVLEYQDADVRFAVHPTIAPLLKMLRAAA